MELGAESLFNRANMARGEVIVGKDHMQI